MRRTIVLVLALILMPAISLLAAGPQQGTGSMNGTAKDSKGKAMANTTVQLRNTATGQLAGTTTSSASGGFSFAGLAPGTYSVEVVNAAGAIVGTSAAVTVAAGAAVTGVTVAATTAAAAAAGGGIGTAAIIGIVAASAGVVTAIAIAQNGSPSK